MLIRIIGLINFERLEKNVDQVKRGQLKYTLGVLKGLRNTEAHKHIKGATKSIIAPSVALTHFKNVYEGLVEFDRVIRLTKY